MRQAWVGLPLWIRVVLLLALAAASFWFLTGAFGSGPRTWTLAELGAGGDEQAARVMDEAQQLAAVVDPGAAVYLDVALPLFSMTPNVPSHLRVHTDSKKLYDAWIHRAGRRP